MRSKSRWTFDIEFLLSQLNPNPTTLYIHIPWCIKKCPYCDFNSHRSTGTLPEEEYIKALIKDLTNDLICFPKRRIDAIFIGGGTPSLFSAKSYDLLFNNLLKILSFGNNIEITIEANPGAVEYNRFKAYRQIGINRLSLGIQSFNSLYLKALGRIHDAKEAHQAILAARLAGFNNINLDLMYALPQQTKKDGLADLETALLHKPEHISWYQLTIEPNTMFYKAPPPLPCEDAVFALEEEGLIMLKASGYERYEISAFAKHKNYSKHNLNYWLFGDYYGIGAGAHSKITIAPQKIIRTIKFKQPKDYLNENKQFISSKVEVALKDLFFEYMLNTTRLERQISKKLFFTNTGLPFAKIRPKILQAAQQGLLAINKQTWQVTPLGRRYTNDLQALFL